MPTRTLKSRAVRVTCAFVLSLPFACVTTGARVPLPSSASASVPSLRLPSDVVPVSYALELAVDPSLPTFTGRGVIRVKVSGGPRDVLWLHARGLAVSSARVVPASGAPIDASLHVVDEKDGVAALALASPLGAGEHALEFAWTGTFTPDLDGAYRVQEGSDWYAFTQFEAVSARRCFPSFDEPGFKAPIDLTLVVPAGANAFANMPVAEEKTLENGSRSVRFEKTPPLPTYLLAFAVGPFDVVEGPSVPASAVREKPLPLRAIATKGKGPKLAYVLARTGGILAELERWFGRAHPTPKLDIVAVPAFAAGAMENPGLVTFKDSLLLFDDGPAPADQAFAFANVMAHELAHQWFGNLVTPAWWDEIWLNEAFATWMATRTVEAWNPSLRANLDLGSDVLRAMDADALAASRRVREPITSLDDVFNAFDEITYSKGAGVIAMFERWLGADRFRDAVRNHLKWHADGTATTEDFLFALAAAARDAGRPGDTVAAFKTFLDQPGVPFLDVETGCTKGGPGTSDVAFLKVRQSRYLPLGTAASAASADATWGVPFCASVRQGEGPWVEACALLTGRESTVPLPFCPDVVLPNRGARGYFRHSIPAELRRAFADETFRRSLSDVERLALADSAEASLRSGHATFAETLETLAPLTWETEPELVQKPLDLLRTAAEEYLDDEGRTALRRYAAGLLRTDGTPSLARDPARNDRAVLVANTRLRFLVRVLDDATVREQAAALGLAWITTGKLSTPAVPEGEPTFLPLALHAALLEHGARAFDAIDAKLTTTLDGTNRRRLLGALSQARGALSDRTLALALDPRLRPDEPLGLLFGQAGHPATREKAWNWLKTNWDALAAKVPEEARPYLAWVPVGLCDDARLDEVRDFLTPRITPAPGGPRELAQAMEALHLCAAQRAAQREDARKRFSGR